jgi:RHS repeat-associated protein
MPEGTLSDHMKITKTFTRAFAWGCLASLASAIAFNAEAQESVSQYQEQGKLFRAPQALGVLGNDLFGDKVNLYTGALEFVQTDVSLPGNNALPVSMGRRLVVGTMPTNRTSFGRWDMDIPHLHGIFADGWKAGVGTDPNLRCSQFGAPPTVKGNFSNNPASFLPTEYWHGSFMYVPGHGDQEMLRRSFGNTVAPGGNASQYPVVTRNNWQISCLPSLAGGGSGEAFLALAPDGTKYRFDWMVSRGLTRLTKTNPGPDPSTSLTAGPRPAALSKKVGALPTPNEFYSNALNRSEVWILPTLIADRYGNTVTYTYNPANRWQLQTIVSNDIGGSPRVLTLTYVSPTSNLIATVSDGTRTWRYSYSDTSDNAQLTKVTLPDNSTWQLANLYPLLKGIEYNSAGSCEEGGNFETAPLSGSLIHPSGARGDFTLTPTRHARADVTNDCQNPDSESPTAHYPNNFDTYALTRKEITGAGLGSLTWTTTYPQPMPSWAPCNGCVATKTVVVSGPEGHATRHTFGTLFQQTEGMLLETEVVDASGSVLRTITIDYAEPVTPRGVSEQGRGDGIMAARIMETGRRVIDQQGATFTWTATAFNAYAQPTVVTRSSSLGYARTEQTDYNNDTAKWILGQVEKVTEKSTGRIAVLNGYNSSTANLESVTKFGKLEQTLSYYPDGTLWTRKDGKGQTTTFANYKRGLAQKATYANGTSESATVDNIGLIRTVTNAAGFTTTYDYDAMGRLRSITHPSGDSVVWNPTTITYTQVPGDEYGLSAGHWREAINTGNASATTYYDALWRPVYSEQWDNADRNGTVRVVRRQFDSAGHKTFESYPKRSYALASDGVHQEYDALGRPTITSTDSELGTLYKGSSYIDGFRKVVTDERHHSRFYSFQTFDEPSENAIAHISMPLGVEVAIERDVFGKPRSITRSGNGKSLTRSYVYDAAQRLCKTIEPETKATVQDYDDAGNVAWRAPGLSLLSTTDCSTASVPATRKISYQYDALNRLGQTTFGDGSPLIKRDYTADGLPYTITSNGATWTNSYNKRRLNEQESLAYGGVTYTFDRRYDANGSLLKVKYPQDSTWLDYSPNALGEPRQVGTYATGIAYHPNGAIAAFRYGNGIVHTLSPNRRGLPEWSQDVGILKDNYGYDENGNVTSIADWQEGITNRGIEYDDLDRLVHVNGAKLWGDAWYSYDALDNLVSSRLTAGGTARNLTHTIDPATSRVASVSNSAGTGYNLSLQYDDNGNVKQRGGQAYVFDLGNRLASAPGKGTYVYDGLGHRVSVVGSDGVNRIQVYSQDGKLLFTKPSNATNGTKYMYLHNHVIAEVTGGAVQYDHTDGLGSPVALTDAAGKLISRTRYEPYGATAAGATPGIGFTGHMNAPELGLVYMQQRYYDPVAGRFLSIDPVTTDANTGGSFNRYAYANNSPFRYTDPDGRDARDDQIARDLAKTRENFCQGQCSGGTSSVGATSGNNGASSQQNSGTSGTGPNNRGAYGADIAAAQLEGEGFVLLGREVVAWIAGTTNIRRYDLVVQNPANGLIFCVEVKTSLFDSFKLNPQQVAFDVRAIQGGAQTALGVTVNSIMYRGVSFGAGPVAVWNTIKLAGALKAAGVPFHTTKSVFP